MQSLRAYLWQQRTIVMIIVCASTMDLQAQNRGDFRSPWGPVIQTQQSNSDASEKPQSRRIFHMPEVQESFELIHRRSRLIVARGNIIRTAIADPSVIDVVQYTPNEISVIGVSPGSTTLTLWFDDGTKPSIYLVNINRDPSREEQRRIDYSKLEQKLSLLFPHSEVVLIPMSHRVVVKGRANNSIEAARILQIVRGEVSRQNENLRVVRQNERKRKNVVSVRSIRGDRTAEAMGSGHIVNMLDVPRESQVMLRVRIAELNRTQLCQSGIDLSYLFDGGTDTASSPLDGHPSTLTSIFENSEIWVLVNSLAGNGTAKILSEPILTVLNGHSASFLSGGEFAVPPMTGIDGTQSQATTFRSFGASLSVTPEVLDKELIRVRIVIEFSRLNQAHAVNGIPGLDSRKFQTTVDLNEGQTLAIAGLLADRTVTEVKRIPLLGDIPHIGPRWFRSKKTCRSETELLIMVTPELVRSKATIVLPPVPKSNMTPPEAAYSPSSSIPVHSTIDKFATQQRLPAWSKKTPLPKNRQSGPQLGMHSNWP